MKKVSLFFALIVSLCGCLKASEQNFADLEEGFGIYSWVFDLFEEESGKGLRLVWDFPKDEEESRREPSNFVLEKQTDAKLVRVLIQMRDLDSIIEIPCFYRFTDEKGQVTKASGMLRAPEGYTVFHSVMPSSDHPNGDDGYLLCLYNPTTKKSVFLNRE